MVFTSPHPAVPCSPVRPVKRHRSPSQLAVLVALALALPVPLTPASSQASPSPFRASASPSQALPTLSQLEADIQQSVQVKVAPNPATTVPPLLSVGTTPPQLDHPDPGACYPNTNDATTVPEDLSTACVWGDTSAKRSIFLFGDSQAWMWLPAFDAIGRTIDWKIYFTAMPGCPPWIDPTKVNYDGSSAVVCNEYQHAEIRAIDALHPQFVIPLGMEADYGRGHWATHAQFVSQLESLSNALRPSGARLLFLDPIPQFNPDFTSATPQTCLTAHAREIQSCFFPPKDLVAPWLLQGIAQLVSRNPGSALVDTTRLFCTQQHCALFVVGGRAVHLVYQDAYHMNLWYCFWISSALQTLLAPELH